MLHRCQSQTEYAIKKTLRVCIEIVLNIFVRNKGLRLSMTHTHPTANPRAGSTHRAADTIELSDQMEPGRRGLNSYQSEGMSLK